MDPDLGRMLAGSACHVVGSSLSDCRTAAQGRKEERDNRIEG